MTLAMFTPNGIENNNISNSDRIHIANDMAAMNCSINIASNMVISPNPIKSSSGVQDFGTVCDTNFTDGMSNMDFMNGMTDMNKMNYMDLNPMTGMSNMNINYMTRINDLDMNSMTGMYNVGIDSMSGMNNMEFSSRNMMNDMDHPNFVPDLNYMGSTGFYDSTGGSDDLNMAHLDDMAFTEPADINSTEPTGMSTNQPTGMSFNQHGTRNTQLNQIALIQTTGLDTAYYNSVDLTQPTVTNFTSPTRMNLTQPTTINLTQPAIIDINQSAAMNLIYQNGADPIQSNGTEACSSIPNEVWSIKAPPQPPSRQHSVFGSTNLPTHMENCDVELDLEKDFPLIDIPKDAEVVQVWEEYPHTVYPGNGSASINLPANVDDYDVDLDLEKDFPFITLPEDWENPPDSVSPENDSDDDASGEEALAELRSMPFESLPRVDPNERTIDEISDDKFSNLTYDERIRLLWCFFQQPPVEPWDVDDRRRKAAGYKPKRRCTNSHYYGDGQDVTFQDAVVKPPRATKAPRKKAAPKKATPKKATAKKNDRPNAVIADSGVFKKCLPKNISDAYSGAIRQREALEKAARLQAEGRRR